MVSVMKLVVCVIQSERGMVVYRVQVEHSIMCCIAIEDELKDKSEWFRRSEKPDVSSSFPESCNISTESGNLGMVDKVLILNKYDALCNYVHVL